MIIILNANKAQTECYINGGIVTENKLQTYKKLGFIQLVKNENYIILTDKSTQLILFTRNESMYKDISIVFLTSSYKEVIKDIDIDTCNFYKKNNYYVIKYKYFKFLLIQVESKDIISSNRQMLDELNPQKPEQYPDNTLGLFGELSYPVVNINEDINYLTRLGFKLKVREKGNYEWAILTNGNILIGLHETKDFKDITTTYFSYNVIDRIEKLKKVVNISVSEIIVNNKVIGANINIIDSIKLFLFKI